MWTYSYTFQSLPILYAYLALSICGICAAHSDSWLAWIIGLSICLLVFGIHVGARARTLLACCSLLFCAAYLRSTWNLSTYTQRQASAYNQTGRDLTARVVDVTLSDNPRYKQRITCLASDTPSWYIQCYSNGIIDVHVDDTVQLHQIKLPPQRADRFRLFLIKEEIHATAFIKKEQLSLLHRPKRSLARTIHMARHRLTQTLHKQCSSETFSLLMLIFFGDRLQAGQAYQATRELFNGWGVMHFLARSGLHLVLFIMALTWLLQYIPCSFSIKQCTLLAMCTLYHLLSWPSISFIRALFTFYWYTACMFFNLQIDTVRIVISVAIICLLYNPPLLFFLDFQLSFGLTLVLALITHYTKHRP